MLKELAYGRIKKFMSKLNCWLKLLDDDMTSVKYTLKEKKGKNFPTWLQNRVISVGLVPVLSQTEKSHIVSYYRQFNRRIFKLKS